MDKQSTARQLYVEVDVSGSMSGLTAENLYIEVMNDCPTVRKMEARARRMQAHMDAGTYKPEHRHFLSWYPFEMIPASIGDIVMGFRNTQATQYCPTIASRTGRMCVEYYETECGLGNFRGE